MKYKNTVSILVIACFFLIGGFLINKDFSNNFKYLKVADTTIRVEVVSNSPLRERGLSGREFLEEDEGMFFIFDYPGKHSFWMKDMNFPIDIIWLDENLEIIYIRRNVLPESYPATFSPDEDSLYVLEVVSDFSNIHKLKIGDKVEFVK